MFANRAQYYFAGEDQQRPEKILFRMKIKNTETKRMDSDTPCLYEGDERGEEILTEMADGGD